MSSFERSLRGGGGTTTPRSKVNNRYGLVGTGSRGPIDADELEGGSPAGSESSSPSVTRNTTPRQGGRYASTFNTMVGLSTPHSCSFLLDSSSVQPGHLEAPTAAAFDTANHVFAHGRVLLLSQHGFGSGPRSTPRTRSALAPAGRPPVPRQNSMAEGGDGMDAASVAESDDVSVMTEDDYGPQEGDSVQVLYDLGGRGYGIAMLLLGTSSSRPQCGETAMLTPWPCAVGLCAGVCQGASHQRHGSSRR